MGFACPAQMTILTNFCRATTIFFTGRSWSSCWILGSAKARFLMSSSPAAAATSSRPRNLPFIWMNNGFRGSGRHHRIGLGARAGGKPKCGILAATRVLPPDAGSWG